MEKTDSQTESKGYLASEELWGAVCTGDEDAVKEYFNGGGAADRKYRRFGSDHSLIMGAFRNGEVNMCMLLASFGETVTPEERKEIDSPDRLPDLPDGRRKELLDMLNNAVSD